MMTFEQAQSVYQAWRAQLDARQVSWEQFQAAIGQIRVVDSSGAQWAMDASTGGWLRWNGSGWEAAGAASPQVYGQGGQWGAAQAQGYVSPPTAPATGMYPQPQYETAHAAPPAAPLEQAGEAPAKSTWSQRIWDILGVAGSSGMAAAWYWYTSLDPYVKPDYKTCAAMVIIPVLLIVLRDKIDGWLAPLQPIRAKVPRMVLLGMGAASPLLISNFLYASGSSNYPYMLKTYVLSTLVSYIILRQPPRGAAGLTTGRAGGTI